MQIVEFKVRLEPLEPLEPQESQEPQDKKPIVTSSVMLKKSWRRLFWQILCFGMVGGLNTAIDLLALNGLLWLWPTQDATHLLVYNSFAYAFGAVNSFILNKHWTFKSKQRTTYTEVLRFALTTACGIACNDLILWMVGQALHPAMINTTLWANASKVLAICGTFMISYVGMHLWVFVHHPQEGNEMDHISTQNENIAPLSAHKEVEHIPSTENNQIQHSLSVILPAYNEEQVIGSTIQDVLAALDGRIQDFEVIVVNDGSKDQTAAVVQAKAQLDSRVRLVSHPVNEGYGAALVDGFAAATKELTFFMDSDGQFDIRNLFQFFNYIGEYDAVLGYRIDRQDIWMRKLNAWGWKMLIGIVLDVHVRDLDCAFKLLRTDFLHTYPLESRGAMINAELLYKLNHSGATYQQIGVEHLPRRGGQATGANPRVILRAMRELFTYKRKYQLSLQKATSPIIEKVPQHK